MKAIKLASVFAVTAVAAAVSTVSVAAEAPPAVFTGYAGLVYQGGEGKTDGTKSKGEVNIIADTGVVYFDVDMVNGAFVLDEAYVKQGAVSFGDFDGSLSDSAVMYGGVEEGNDYSTDLGITLGVRYQVMDGLKVAVEAVENNKDVFLAAAYTMPIGPASLTVSGAFGNTDDTTQTVAVGVSVPAGEMITFEAYTQSGKNNGASLSSIGAGVDVALSDALTLSAAFLDDTETDADDSVTEVSLFYTAGDLTYYATTLQYAEDGKDYSLVGVKASF